MNAAAESEMNSALGPAARSRSPRHQKLAQCSTVSW